MPQNTQNKKYTFELESGDLAHSTVNFTMQCLYQASDRWQVESTGGSPLSLLRGLAGKVHRGYFEFGAIDLINN